MKAIELLVSPAVHQIFARMEDGSYRWVKSGMDGVLGTGPAIAWVARGLTAKAASLYGQPSIQRILCHDVLLASLNKAMER